MFPSHIYPEPAVEYFSLFHDDVSHRLVVSESLLVSPIDIV